MSMECHISDSVAPIVILFGYPYSGKTIALIRLAKYLKKNGYFVTPDSIFRSKEDSLYCSLCSEYSEMFQANYEPPGNSLQSYLLAKVLNTHGQTHCQILDMPGEHCFDRYNPSRMLSFPLYLNTIIQSPNKKVWTIFVNSSDFAENNIIKEAYAKTIGKISDYMSPKDKIIFVFNKVDLCPELISQGRLNKNCLLKRINYEFPEIFEKYKNFGLKRLLFGENNFEIVYFSAGTFYRNEDSRRLWSLGSDTYCSEYWNAIQKAIK